MQVNQPKEGGAEASTAMIIPGSGALGCTSLISQPISPYRIDKDFRPRLTIVSGPVLGGEQAKRVKTLPVGKPLAQVNMYPKRPSTRWGIGMPLVAKHCVINLPVGGHHALRLQLHASPFVTARLLVGGAARVARSPHLPGGSSDGPSFRHVRAVKHHSEGSCHAR